MPNEKRKPSQDFLDWLISVALALPWIEIFAELWKVARALARGLADEGMYEVLEYEGTLELHDKRGERATFRKREKVRYLQDSIIAYQDQAWGDGRILLNYRCTPGKQVDRSRPGYKTFILISLQDVKKRGDIDEFHIEWQMAGTFKRQTELWEMEISHRTREIRLQIIFPKSRPPRRSWLIEYMQRRTKLLDGEAKRRLPDGRWMVQWQMTEPRPHERYQLRWEW